VVVGRTILADDEFFGTQALVATAINKIKAEVCKQTTGTRFFKYNMSFTFDWDDEVLSN